MGERVDAQSPQGAGELEVAVRELERNLALSAEINDTLAMAIDLNNMVDMLLAAGRVDEAEKRNRELVRHIVEDPAQPENQGDEEGYRRMLGYVVGYRGVLNLGYAKVRREAEERLRKAAGGR